MWVLDCIPPILALLTPFSLTLDFSFLNCICIHVCISINCVSTTGPLYICKVTSIVCGCVYLSNYVFSYLLCISTVDGSPVCICPISIIVYCDCVNLSNYVFSYLCIFVSYLCISTVAGGGVYLSNIYNSGITRSSYVGIYPPCCHPHTSEQ